MATRGWPGLKMAPGRPKLMIFGPIACFRRSGSRLSGHKGLRSSEMRVYIGTTGHIKKSSKFQNFILVPGVQKTDFYDFSGFFLRKNGPGIREAGIRNTGISSETTWESRVRRLGNHEWDDSAISSETTWSRGVCWARGGRRRPGDEKSSIGCQAGQAGQAGRIWICTWKTKEVSSAYAQCW